MQNLIRHYRRQRGLSLHNLGQAIGLTPQSVSRIETGKMRLSTDWLELIAQALRVRPVDLLDTPAGTAQLIGELDGSGALIPRPPAPFRLALPAQGAKIVQMHENCGPYLAGEYLVCEQLKPAATARSIGHDCLIEAPDGAIRLGRLVALDHKAGTATAVLALLNSGDRIIDDQPVNSISPVRMVLRMVS